MPTVVARATRQSQRKARSGRSRRRRHLAAGHERAGVLSAVSIVVADGGGWRFDLAEHTVVVFDPRQPWGAQKPEVLAPPGPQFEFLRMNWSLTAGVLQAM